MEREIIGGNGKNHYLCHMTDNFDYITFDRQMQNLIASATAITTGWEDITTLEMNIDLKSLCLKASRLCAMSETDYVLQQQEVTHTRIGQNRIWESCLNDLLSDMIAPLVQKVVAGIRTSNRMEGHRSEMFPGDMAGLLPRLAELQVADGMKAGEWDTMIADTMALERELHRKYRQTVFPGMDYRERFWLLYELYALMCYLLFHFRRVVRLCETDVPTEDAGMRLQGMVDYYVASDNGRNELERYWTELTFRRNPSAELIETAERELLHQVPKNMQLSFMRHADDIHALACEVQQSVTSPEECLQFVEVLAKWQKLEHELVLMRDPDAIRTGLYNEVFKPVMESKPVDMAELRNRIRLMLPYVGQKNLWLCVWNVLRFRGYLASTSLAAFASQMMHDDWFGHEKGVLSFSADTLNEYSGFFTDGYFTVWRECDYDNYRKVHDKKKWGDSLCRKFRTICETMDDAFAKM